MLDVAQQCCCLQPTHAISFTIQTAITIQKSVDLFGSCGASSEASPQLARGVLCTDRVLRCTNRDTFFTLFGELR
jgi:hypothetical protein